jgi:hypothetical protein
VSWRRAPAAVLTRRALIWALVIALAAILAIAERTGPARAQTGGTITIVLTGDVSPPTNETSGNDHSTAELIRRLDPFGVCVNGDNQYEYGHPAMFAAETGFHGSYGRLFHERILCSAPGNHDAADPGPGSPGWYGYFRANLDADDTTGAAALACLTEPNPCRPELGYYAVDLPVSPGASQLGWTIYVLDSNCQRAGGGTGDVQTESCASTGRMANWLRDAYNRRHGGQTSGRKCSLMVWHHERWGTGFFADDPATQHLWGIGNHYHNDIVGSGHSHSLARLGAMQNDGRLSPTGSGQRQLTTGAGGRSLTANRVEPARHGTRERYNTKYGVARVTLVSTPNAAGWLGGSWTSQFHFTDGTATTPASAGCWP